MARNKPEAGATAKSLIQNLQSQLDAGSNSHLEQLLEVVSVIEDDINELLCDLETATAAMDIYAIAGSACQRGEIHLSDVTAVFLKLLPKSHDWDSRLHQQFTRLHALKRGLAHH